MDRGVVSKMLAQVENWEQSADSRAVFLRCYMMMTENMLAGIEQGEFTDPAWVERLLNRFADYYFVALEAYDQDPASTPAIWRLAHLSTADAQVVALQKLLYGVNAHINYDLVLTLVDLLEPEWAALSEAQRLQRYTDHCAVNAVIGRTIDAVQDQVLEVSMPSMEFIDKLLGPLDELLISRLISQWREVVWESAVRLLNSTDPSDRHKIIQLVEADALRKADAINFTNWRTALRELW